MTRHATYRPAGPFDTYNELRERESQAIAELGAVRAAAFRARLSQEQPRLTTAQLQACEADLIDMMQAEHAPTVEATYREWRRRIAPAPVQRYAETLLAQTGKR